MKKKVIFVITKSVWGGAQKYVYDLATNLPTDRFDITVAAGGDGPLFQKLQSAGVRTIHVPELDRDVQVGKEFRSFRALLNLFQHEQPDIIHLNSSKVGGLGAVAGRIVSLREIPRSGTTKPTKKKTRVIFTVHGWGFLEDRPLLWRIAIFLASWVSALFQDKIILINSRDYATAWKFIPRRKLVLIRNGLAEHACLEREDARRFLSKKTPNGIRADTLLIGTLAELTKNKGLEYLINAIHRMRAEAENGSPKTDAPPAEKMKVLIIGQGEDRTRLERQIRDLHLQDAVFLLGFVPDAAQYLSGMDIFVLPSRKEGLPYVIMEAMAAGVAVIASDVGGVPDLVSQNETGVLVAPKNSEALAKTIQLLAQNPEQRAALGKRGRDAVGTKFSLRAMLEQTESLYETAD